MEHLLTGFWNAFWLFLGVVAGALIQFILSSHQIWKQQANARSVLLTELDLNLGEIEVFRKHLHYLKERVAAEQIDDDALFISMHSFDYSAVGPLANSGHFHLMLGAAGVKKYLSFMRFFNNENAKVINSMLATEHARGKSMDFLDWLVGRCFDLEAELSSLKG